MTTNEKTAMQMVFESHNRAGWDEYYMRSYRQQWEAAWEAAVDDQRHRNRALLQQALDALKNNSGEMRIEGAKNILREALAVPATLTPSELADRIERGERWAAAPQRQPLTELETMNADLREQNTTLDAACAKLESANAELLEACNLFVAYDSHDQTNHFEMMLTYADAIEAARAAIAKHGIGEAK